MSLYSPDGLPSHESRYANQGGSKPGQTVTRRCTAWPLIDHRHNVLTDDLGPGHDVVCSIWMLIDVHGCSRGYVRELHGIAERAAGRYIAPQINVDTGSGSY